MHCFAGCTAEDVLDALGMSFVDLYPAPARAARKAFIGRRRRLPPLEPLDHERRILLMAAADLHEHLHRDVSLTLNRIAITPEQIEHLDLPAKPRKTGDRRALHVRETVEAEAVPAHQMRALLRGCVEEFLPSQALHVARAAEQSEREHLKRVALVMERGR